MKNNKKIDSILTSKKIYSWFWFKNKPINYKPEILPRSQDAQPVVVETTGLYGIKKSSLKKYKCRIGRKPFFYETEDEEAIDIDNKKDIEYLKYQVLKQKNKFMCGIFGVVHRDINQTTFKKIFRFFGSQRSG